MADGVFFVRSLYAYDGDSTGALSFKRLEILEVSACLQSGWWDGTIVSTGVRGWFPSNYVTRITDEEAAWAFEQGEAVENSAQDAYASERTGNSNGVANAANALEQAIWASLSGSTSLDDDVTASFSSGGDIFAEIAAASASPPKPPNKSPSANNSQSNSPQRRTKPLSNSNVSKVDDYWEPKLTNDGRIMFVNSRTGEISSILPATAADPASSPTSESPTFDFNNSPNQHKKSQSDQSLTSDFYSNLHRKDSVVPADWVVRTLHDGVTTYYENTKTRETRWSFPGRPASPSDSPRSVQPRSEQRLPSVSTTRTAKQSLPESETRSTPKTSAMQTHQSHMSFDSDDSATDAMFEQKDRNKSTSNAVKPTEGVDRTPPELDFFFPALPVLATLEDDVQARINRILSHISTCGESFGSSDRSHLSDISADLIASIRALLQAAGLVEHILATSATATTGHSHSPSRALSALDEAKLAQTRPYLKRVTSPLNKLVLNVRALWGMMDTLEDEEATVQAILATVEIEEDLRNLTDARNDVIGSRLAGEIQLRADITTKAEDLAKAILLLTAFLATQASTPELPFVSHIQGHFVSDTTSLLGVANGRGANWKGNAFSLDQSNTKTAKFPASPVPSLKAVYPQGQLTEEGIQALATLNRDIVLAVADLKGSIDGLKASAAKQDFADERQTLFSAQVQTEAFHNAEAIKQLGPLAASISTLSTLLGNQLGFVEDWALSDRLDVEVNENDLFSLLLAAYGLDPKGKGKAKDVSATVDDYKETVYEARRALTKFNEMKQALYDERASLLLYVQQLGVYESTREASAHGCDYVPVFSQPDWAHPLNDFLIPAVFDDVLRPLEQDLSDIETSSQYLLASSKQLLTICQRQNKAAPGLRTADERRRTVLQSHRLSQLSLASSTSSRPDSQRSHSSSFTSNRPNNRLNLSVSSNASDLPTREILKASQPPNSGVQLPYLYSGVDSYTESIRSGKDSVAASEPFTNRTSQVVTMQPSSSNESIQESPTTRSPSTSKIKQFFGNDAPAPEFVQRARAVSQAPEIPSFLRLDYEEELSFNIDGQVKGGTLRSLVARLASHEHTIDHTYIKSFLLTYRTFTTSQELFRLLVQRYHAAPPQGLTTDQYKVWSATKQTFIRLRTVNIIKTWLESYFWEPVNVADSILRAIQDFAMNGIADPVSTQQLVRAVERRRTTGLPRRMSAVDSSLAPSPVLPRNSKKLKFLDLDATEIARQLTLINSQQYAKITPDECMSKVWPKKFGSNTPNISAMTAFENHTSSWVKDVILSFDDAKKRATAIKHFVAIAERCQKLQNFSILVHIIAGIDSGPILRLKRTWELVNSKTNESFRVLKTLMSHDRKFAQYREALKTMGPPCVPFMGVFLTSWTYIGDAMPDFLTEHSDQINFFKRQRAAELMQQIELHQSTAYNLVPVKVVSDYLLSAISQPQSEAALWEQSLVREPKERPDESIARLLSESGFL